MKEAQSSTLHIIGHFWDESFQPVLDNKRNLQHKKPKTKTTEAKFFEFDEGGRKILKEIV